MPSRKVTYKGITLIAYYDEYPPVYNNQGHPDSRLPDEPHEVCVTNVCIDDFDPEWIGALLLEELNRERDSE